MLQIVNVSVPKFGTRRSFPALVKPLSPTKAALDLAPEPLRFFVTPLVTSVIRTIPPAKNASSHPSRPGCDTAKMSLAWTERAGADLIPRAQQPAHGRPQP